MTRKIIRRLAGVAAIVSMMGSGASALAGPVPIAMNVDIEETAILDISVDSSEVAIRGEDIDHVAVRALITVDSGLSSTDPIKAGTIVSAIKRSPPIDVNGDRIEITSLKKRTHQRHVSMAYEILVPRDTEINVHSESGNVTVSGVTGPVQATSDSGTVTVAEVDGTGSTASGG